jgi:hypothetical protein
MTNIEKLQKAEILADPHGLSKQDVETIEHLSPEEVDTWVRIKEKLGDDFVRRNCTPKCMI